MFSSAPGTVPSFHDMDGNTYCAVPVYQHPDPDLARDPQSTNRRLPETVDLAMLGTLVVAGPTPDHIRVLILDTVGPTVDAESPAANLSSSLPPVNLALALCDNSVLPTLGLGRWDYWDEINPILRKWQSINDARCPECDRLIRVNMSCHLRLSHMTCQCFWRCPVPSFPCGLLRSLMGRITWSGSIISQRAEDIRSTIACVNLGWNGLAGGPSINVIRPVRLCGWTSTRATLGTGAS